MRNQKVVIVPLLMSSALWLLFIRMGLKTMSKYVGTPGNWHFIAALSGTILFTVLLLIALIVFFFPERFQKMYWTKFKSEQ